MSDVSVSQKNNQKNKKIIPHREPDIDAFKLDKYLEGIRWKYMRGEIQNLTQTIERFQYRRRLQGEVYV